MASLSNEAKNKVMIWSEQYEIRDNKMSSGVALSKIIIRKSHLNSNATTNRSAPPPTLSPLTAILGSSI